MMAYRHFRNAGALPHRVDRDEAMHLAIQPHILDDLAAISLQCAAVVVQWHAEKPGDEPVGNNRWQLARQCSILARLAPTGNDIVSLLQFGYQLRDIGRIILSVSIHRDDNVADAVLDSGHDR